MPGTMMMMMMMMMMSAVVVTIGQDIVLWLIMIQIHANYISVDMYTHAERHERFFKTYSFTTKYVTSHEILKPKHVKLMSFVENFTD